MRILLANPRGFCAGVRMAVDALELALERFGPPVYVFHEIVHNRHIVADFRRRGVVFIDSVQEVPHGEVLMYSAHGVSPEIRAEARKRSLRTINATCPLVTKVHHEGNAGDFRIIFNRQFQKFRQQRHRHVVHAVKAGIFKSRHSGTLARSRKPRNYDDR